LNENDEIISWKSFLDKNQKLWQYSKSGMHSSCFNNWTSKNEFEFLYQYQPLIDFDAPEIKKLIGKNGIPEWLSKIKEFRNKTTLYRQYKKWLGEL
jgi:hypothetical protein